MISIPQILTQEQRENAQAVTQAQAERLGFQALVLDGGITAQLQPGVDPTCWQSSRSRLALPEQDRNPEPGPDRGAG